jgi:hypothetical protein
VVGGAPRDAPLRGVSARDLGDRRHDLPTMALYTGLIGALKNPGSHRQVDFDDPAEAVEVVLFADLLIRTLDRMSSARA